jgi:hypothetical protein
MAPEVKKIAEEYVRKQLESMNRKAPVRQVKAAIRKVAAAIEEIRTASAANQPKSK